MKGEQRERPTRRSERDDKEARRRERVSIMMQMKNREGGIKKDGIFWKDET